MTREEEYEVKYIIENKDYLRGNERADLRVLEALAPNWHDASLLRAAWYKHRRESKEIVGR